MSRRAVCTCHPGATHGPNRCPLLPCACGHAYAEHGDYAEGMGCGTCYCRRFRAQRPAAGQSSLLAILSGLAVAAACLTIIEAMNGHLANDLAHLSHLAAIILG